MGCAVSKCITDTDQDDVVKDVLTKLSCSVCRLQTFSECLSNTSFF